MRAEIPAVALLAAVTNGAMVKRLAEPATLIPKNSYSNFDTYWNYLYPGGVSDHNGGARMDKEHVKTENGNTVVITAEPSEGEPNSEHGDGSTPIHYRSGAIHSKESFTVKKNGGFDFKSEVLVNPVKGTWPAFWCSGDNSWPPEIDFLEWFGDGDVLFNTWNTSEIHDGARRPYNNVDQWHSVNVAVVDDNGSDVKVTFTYDDEVVSTQWGKDYVGKPLNVYVPLVPGLFLGNLRNLTHRQHHQPPDEPGRRRGPGRR